MASIPNPPLTLNLDYLRSGQQFVEKKAAHIPRAKQLPVDPQNPRRAALNDCGVIYYAPSNAKKFNYNGPNNHGFDDEKLRYIAPIGSHVRNRYEIECKVGNGAFSDCWRVFDHKTCTRVAMKIVKNDKRLHAQGRVEIKILEQIAKSATSHSCIKMLDSFLFRSHLCLTFRLQSHCLYSELKRNSFKGFSIDEARGAITKVVTCLSLLKREGIVHGDIKPENILLGLDNNRTNVTVIDFGNACLEKKRTHTYVQSRYYRAPEIVLGQSYGCAIDMWSLGCVLVELITGRPLFRASRDEQELLLLQVEVLGMIPTSILRKKSLCKYKYVHKASKGYRLKSNVDGRDRLRLAGTRPLCKIISPLDPALEDFLRRCLHFDPVNRLTPLQAMSHPFITQQPFSSSSSRSSLSQTQDHTTSRDSGLNSISPFSDTTSLPRSPDFLSTTAMSLDSASGLTMLAKLKSFRSSRHSRPRSHQSSPQSSLDSTSGIVMQTQLSQLRQSRGSLTDNLTQDSTQSLSPSSGRRWAGLLRARHAATSSSSSVVGGGGGGGTRKRMLSEGSNTHPNTHTSIGHRLRSLFASPSTSRSTSRQGSSPPPHTSSTSSHPPSSSSSHHLALPVAETHSFSGPPCTTPLHKDHTHYSDVTSTANARDTLTSHNTNANVNVNVSAIVHTNVIANTNVSANTNANTDVSASTNVNTNVNGNANDNTNIKGKTNGNTTTTANANTNANTNTNTTTNADDNANTNGITTTNANITAIQHDTTIPTRTPHGGNVLIDITIPSNSNSNSSSIVGTPSHTPHTLSRTPHFNVINIDLPLCRSSTSVCATASADYRNRNRNHADAKECGDQEQCGDEEECADKEESADNKECADVDERGAGEDCGAEGSSPLLNRLNRHESVSDVVQHPHTCTPTNTNTEMTMKTNTNTNTPAAIHEHSPTSPHTPRSTVRRQMARAFAARESSLI